MAGKRAPSFPGGEGPSPGFHPGLGGGDRSYVTPRGRPQTSVPIGVPRSLRRRMTRQEVQLWVHLRLPRNEGFHFRRQVPIEDFVVDFACLKGRLVVELDGGQHGLETNAQKDRQRDARLDRLGFRVARFWNTEVDRNLDGVLEQILTELGRAQIPTASAARRTLPFGEG